MDERERDLAFVEVLAEAFLLSVLVYSVKSRCLASSILLASGGEESTYIFGCEVLIIVTDLEVSSKAFYEGTELQLIFPKPF